MEGRRVVRAATDEEALRLGLVPGTVAVWVDDTSTEAASHAWRLATSWERTARRCRWTLASPRRACGQPSAAMLWRVLHRRGGRTSLQGWFYCVEHLYGRRIEDGRILALTRIPDSEAPR